MTVVIVRYPFLLALLAALLIELSAILIRRAAQTLGGWLWILAGILSSIGAVTLIWSFIWANGSDGQSAIPTVVFNNVLGPVLCLIGIVGILRPLLQLGRQAWFPWTPTRLITRETYRLRRRPMTVGMALLAVGVPLTMNQLQGWIWFAVWFVLVQPLLELEEWEMRGRFPEAAAYFESTPRYFRWPKRRV